MTANSNDGGFQVWVTFILTKGKHSDYGAGRDWFALGWGQRKKGSQIANTSLWVVRAKLSVQGMVTKPMGVAPVQWWRQGKQTTSKCKNDNRGLRAALGKHPKTSKSKRGAKNAVERKKKKTPAMRAKKVRGGIQLPSDKKSGWPLVF